MRFFDTKDFYWFLSALFCLVFTIQTEQIYAQSRTVYFVSKDVNSLSYLDSTILKDSKRLQKKGSFVYRDHQIIFSDSVRSSMVLQEIIYSCYRDGYISASFEELQKDTLSFFQGLPYRTVRFTLDSTDTKQVIIHKQFPGYFQGDTIMSPVEFQAYEESFFQWLEDHGYAFAKVQLIHKVRYGQDLNGTLSIQNGIPFEFDNPISEGLPKGFVRQITGITPGMPYSYRQLEQTKQKLKNNDWVSLNGKTTISFAGRKATPKFALKPIQPNRLDFVLGILPSQSGRSTITGTLDAWLFNALNIGELFEVHFERLRPQTQRLESRFRIPYLAGLPVGIDAELKMYKRDSAFLEVITKGGVLYPMHQNGSIGLSWLRRSSSLVQVDTQTILNTRALPSDLDLRQNSFQLSYLFRGYDNRLNPRKGLGIVLDGTVGIHRTLRNAKIENLRRTDQPDFDFATLYDTLQSNGNRYAITIDADYFLPIGKQSTIRTRVNGAYLTSQAALVRNELYRLGGFQQIRGFDEDIFLAKAYATFSAEYRLLTGARSFFSVFAEQSMVDLALAKDPSWAYPLGIGAGIQIETAGGVFGLSMAVGRVNSDPLDFRSPKIHLGYLSKL